jgi:hypothetical protein
VKFVPDGKSILSAKHDLCWDCGCKSHLGRRSNHMTGVMDLMNGLLGGLLQGIPL